MATAGERLATLEEQMRGVREDVRSLMDMVGDRRNPESVRGRLHNIESSLLGLAMRRNYGLGLLKGWERFALVLAGLATAAASWYAVIH